MIELQQERKRVPAVPRRLGPGIALGAAAGPVVFTLAWLVLGFISRGYTAWGVYVPYSPIHQTVSGLGLGATAPFMNGAFIANGILTVAGIIAIFNGIPALGHRARWTCIALLSMPPLGSAIDGIFTLESFLPHTAGPAEGGRRLPSAGTKAGIPKIHGKLGQELQAGSTPPSTFS